MRPYTYSHHFLTSWRPEGLQSACVLCGAACGGTAPLVVSLHLWQEIQEHVRWDLLSPPLADMCYPFASRPVRPPEKSRCQCVSETLPQSPHLRCLQKWMQRLSIGLLFCFNTGLCAPQLGPKW